MFLKLLPRVYQVMVGHRAHRKKVLTHNITVVLRNLMLRVGHEKVLIQGGDWGSIIGSNIATLFPENSIGFHPNSCRSFSGLSILKQIINSNFPSQGKKDGGLEKKFSLDALLDKNMIYYLSNSIATSQRLYAEFVGNFKFKLDKVPTNVTVGCARFRNDLEHNTDWQLKEKPTNMVTSTYYPDDGHYIALELPNVLYDYFVEFV